MPSIHDILTRLQAYTPYDTLENMHRGALVHLIRSVGDVAFLREEAHARGGHVTAGVMAVNPSRTRVLLNLHAQSGLYINFGGHADGCRDVDAVARKEFWEEAGIQEFQTSGNIFDIDAHTIAPHIRKGVQVPEHKHYDINFLAIVPDDVAFTLSDESHDIRWFDIDEAQTVQLPRPDKHSQMQRIYAKIKAGLR